MKDLGPNSIRLSTKVVLVRKITGGEEGPPSYELFTSSAADIGQDNGGGGGGGLVTSLGVFNDVIFAVHPPDAASVLSVGRGEGEENANKNANLDDDDY